MHKERRLITVREAAEYLGLSESKIYRMLKLGMITGIRIGSDWRFDYAGLDRWIDAQPAGKVRPEVHKSPKKSSDQ